MMPELFDVLTYDYEKVSDLLDIPDTYIQALSMLTPDRVPGVYEFGIALTHHFNTAAKSIYLRYSLDGGVIWTEFIGEPSDATNQTPSFYQYPIDHAGGVFDILIEIRIEDVVGELDVYFLDAWVRRVK